MRPDDPKRESPIKLELDEASGGIEALPSRAERYGKAKSIALDVAKYIEQEQPGESKLLARMLACGEYLAFRHYFTIDEVRLHGASFCMKHLLCPLCAIRRGSKALKAYLDRWDAITGERCSLRPFLVTLTVKDGPDLAERFKHLFDAQHELWKRKHRQRGSSLDGVEGAVWSYEVKRGSGSGLWHPHLHMIALAANEPDQAALRDEWHAITGDSHMCDVRPIVGDPAQGFMEVFKYAVKFSDQPPADTWHAYQVLKGKRLLGSAGCFRGVDVPESLLDEPLDGLPYVELFYRYLTGKGYTLTPRGLGR
jgi:hypothetical protein